MPAPPSSVVFHVVEPLAALLVAELPLHRSHRQRRATSSPSRHRSSVALRIRCQRQSSASRRRAAAPPAAPPRRRAAAPPQPPPPAEGRLVAELPLLFRIVPPSRRFSAVLW
uniref:Uncharacterized protein n=1 Tax=Oryza nivara TaxID=4536 RepID=A0A0E0IKQ3_ORYNI